MTGAENVMTLEGATSVVAGRPTLTRVQRQRGRAWPACVARELLDDAGRHVSAPKYPWCDRHGKWLWGEQHLCDLHARQLVTKRLVSGISPNGRWGSCLVHIDCDHSIDDPDWESVYRKGQLADAWGSDGGEAGEAVQGRLAGRGRRLVRGRPLHHLRSPEGRPR